METLLENRISIARLPTPVHYFPRLSEELGVELHIKRDDLTESIASGNKIRKLEYLLYEAKKLGADTLVSCGGIQSNHCRAVAWVAAKTGFSSVLLLRGEKPSSMEGNVLINALLGADIRFFSKEDFENISEIGKQVCAELGAKGKKPYYIPMGGSTATGCLGYVRMVKELADTGIPFDHIYCALGSGGTFAGLWLGYQHFNFPGRVHGIAVCDDISYFVSEVSRIQQEFQEWYDMKTDFSGAGQLMDDQYVGIGYAMNTESELQELIRYARTEGLVLDPVYTLKAFLGMKDHIRRGIVKPGERVLFIHTGGHAGIFPKHSEFEKLIRL
jgi:D-cysteine desulfhydrase